MRSTPPPTNLKKITTVTSITTTVQAGTNLITLNGHQDRFVVVGIPDTTKTLCFTGVEAAPNLAESTEDAHRIATLWNFCQGIPTEKLEDISLAEFISREAYLTGFSLSDEGASVNLKGIGVQVLAASFAGQFKANGATNYLEVHLSHSETGPLSVTIQRIEGQTPG